MSKELIQKKRVKLMQYLAKLFQSEGISYSKLEKETGFIPSNISRMLNGKYSPGLDHVIQLADVGDYDVVFVKKMLNQHVDDEQISPKFLLSIDHKNHELYVLHRQFPACLIWVKQETPVQFIVQDLYDDVENPADILNMPFVEEAKAFYREYAEGLYGGN